MKQYLKTAAVISAVGLIWVGGYLLSQAEDSSKTETATSGSAAIITSDSSSAVSHKVVAYYFHGNRRCPTCRKLEAYSREALQTAFQQELADSTLVWRVINYDQKDNEHYLKDYNLYTKALILSRIKDGQQIEWKNLDKIWELVGNKDMFLKYVQTETGAFLVREKD